MNYYQPQSLAGLFDCLDGLTPDDYTLLAGGTDLIPRYERGADLPEYLIDIKKLDGLDGIIEHEDSIEIGALTSIEAIKRSPLLKNSYTALYIAAREFAGRQIRNRATIGGNICNASPAGDMLPPLYAFGAKLKIFSRNGDRIFPIADFITAPGKSILKQGELLKSIFLEKNKSNSYFYKLGLRASMAISVVSFAIVFDITDGKFTRLKITAGAVAPTVVTLKKLQKFILNSSTISNETASLIDADIAPISDIRASADYRRQALKNVLIYELDSIIKGAD